MHMDRSFEFCHMNQLAVRRLVHCVRSLTYLLKISTLGLYTCLPDIRSDDNIHTGNHLSLCNARLVDS